MYKIILVVSYGSYLNGCTIYISKGMWFGENGFIQRWVITTLAIRQNTQIHLQVYRPSCSGKYLVPPGMYICVD